MNPSPCQRTWQLRWMLLLNTSLKRSGKSPGRPAASLAPPSEISQTTQGTAGLFSSMMMVAASRARLRRCCLLSGDRDNNPESELLGLIGHAINACRWDGLQLPFFAGDW